MRFQRIIVGLTLAGFALAGRLRVFAHEEQVLLVGRNAAGEVVVDSDFPQPVELPVSIFPGIAGYATGELAFHSTILDEPDDDFFQLSTAADFRFVLLAKDPGTEVWNDTASGFMATNETFFIGAPIFDAHPIWNIVNGTLGNSYSLTLKLRDLSGIYPDSAPFVLSFTPIKIRHRINIQKTDAQSVTLSWPTNAVGWELQSASSVTAANWDAITNAAEISGTNFSLSITTTNAQQFYRLRKP